jgi:long-chain fatty acid transport protein
MKTKWFFLLILALTVAWAPAALATNGTNLIGIGPISRSMGGGGVAAPQDAISAVFANPAAACFGPFCPGSSVDFASTWFDPTAKGNLNGVESTSNLDPFVVPAVAISLPLNERLRLGLGFFGVSGLGTDYRASSLADAFEPFFGAPFDIYTQLQTLKFAPNLAYLVTPNFSVGASIEVVWQNLDLGAGSSHGYTVGAQIGALYHWNQFNFGISYITPEKVTHDDVFFAPDLTGTLPRGGTFNDLDIESPQALKLGVAFIPNSRWLFEVNTKWYDWDGADGYKDFGWDDQWVIALGAQWKPIDKWTFRFGYNYGESPIEANNGFETGTLTNVQGVDVPTPAYEALRVLGFPAIVEQHFTAGVGYDITETIILNLAFMYAPEETLTQTSEGGALTYKAKLEEWSTTFGLTLYF